MAKRINQKPDDDTRDAIEQMENEGAPPVPTSDLGGDTDRLILYRGEHPLIRRCGVVLKPRKPKQVAAAIAAQLLAAGDCEDVTPRHVPDPELPPSAA
jgi:hypothetical protein